MTASRRVLALALLVAFGSGGSGVPMCLSLLAHAAQGCHMHGRQHDTGTHHEAPQSVQLVAYEPGEVGACHPDSTTPDCATGGVCPSGGPATASPLQGAVVLLDAAPALLLGPATSYLSYSAPPLSPPPQV